MLSKTVDVSDKRIKLVELLSEVREGQDIILMHNDKALARLVPISPGTDRPRTPGLHRGAIKMQPGFDEPLGDEFWLGAA